jgi:Leucine-rich repeat (LRR) protein
MEPHVVNFLFLHLIVYYRNHITSVAVNWRDLKDTVTDLYLGDNEISFLPLDPSLSLSSFTKLKWLKLDNNDVSSLEPNSLPFSLKTLGLTSNQLTTFPSEVIANLKDLGYIYLKGNYIDRLPTDKFSQRKTLEDLDLADNGITALTNLFGGSIAVKDLKLDSNAIDSIPMNVFKGLSCVRLNLSNNKIHTINDRAFFTLSNSLEYLDLGNNKLASISRGIKLLKKLKHLYLSNNRITTVTEDSFANVSQSLRSLSLSGNYLRFIPSSSLYHLKKLNRLNLGYNRISGPLATNYEEWGETLDTLLLMGNRITRIKGGSFDHLHRVKELSLAFNEIDVLDETCFEPMSKTLESLDIGFGFRPEAFPETPLKPLTSLVWLALDNNRIKTLTRTTLYSFGNLQYLNLDGNRITELPEFFFHSGIHKNLKDIRLSFNRMLSLGSHSFSGLKELQSVVLTGNQIAYVEENAFQNLPNTLTVILADNRIGKIFGRAFVNIPNLAVLDLHGNALKDFNILCFKNVTNHLAPMSLNLSYNEIGDLYGGDFTSSIHVKVLDLSFNRLSTVPLQFMTNFNDSLRRLELGYNRILMLLPGQFSKFGSLETLQLEHNGIVSLKHDCFHEMHNLQVLDLSNNHIEQIHMQQFHLKNLRILDLSNNHLRSIPRDAFQGTRLERLILANNEFVVIPAPPFMEVGYTLRVLDFSHNQIEHLDTTMFSEAPLLTELNLSHNKLGAIPASFFR